MAFRVCSFPGVLFFLAAATASGQGPSAGANPPIIQPGAPGQNSRSLSASAAIVPVRAPSPADVSFMQGMIMHHSQAVEMTDLLRTHTRTKSLQALGKRISISQTDEMKFMKQWLTDRGFPTSPAMDGANMATMLMPGMLTPDQMKALGKATGPAFDQLFLTGMIQHHTGALTMVQDLIATPGAGQDAVLFDFSTDVDNTQTAEINIMKGLLKEKK